MNQHAHQPRPGAARALWALAAVLSTLILLRAGHLAPESTAVAEMVGQSGDYTAMTTNSGSEELLYVVDGRNERLLVYRVLGTRAVELMDTQDLRQMFISARAAWLGGEPTRP